MKQKYYIWADQENPTVWDNGIFSCFVKHRFGVYCQIYFSDGRYELAIPSHIDSWIEDGYLVEVSESELALIIS